jgi:hypothetical protein
MKKHLKKLIKAIKNMKLTEPIILTKDKDGNIYIPHSPCRIIKTKD